MDTEMSSPSWRGVPLSEIVGSQSPWGAPEFPLVTPSHNSTVLYHIPSNGDLAEPLKPQIGQDVWDSEHVRMPCSSKSLYPVEGHNGEPRLRKRWLMIEEALRNPILNSQQLADAILSYNTKFKRTWRFRALHYLFNEHLDEDETQYFFSVTLPQIIKLALDLPKLIQAPIPLLKQHKNHSISMTQQQVASLLANAFFCTFPRRNTGKKDSEYALYPHINFSALYECAPHEDIMAKLTCLCHYFRRVSRKAGGGVVTISRRSVAMARVPAWRGSRATVAATPLHVDAEGKIEDAHALIQLDFANKYLGGGVLGHGCVQEEIRFVICPELMISMLFTEVLRPNEALMMIGCERYSSYEGYGSTFRWAGDYEDSTPLDASGRKRVAVLAIDALPYSSSKNELRKELFTRELNKAWVGFSSYTDDQPVLQYPGLATGNWGCGAFGGSPELKCLIQLMAASEARRPVAYYTFGDVALRDKIVNIYDFLARHNITVGELYKHIESFSQSKTHCSHLHAYLQQALLDEKNRSSQRELDLEPDPMDVSTSPKTSPVAEKSLQKSIRRCSPDMFSSQDDTPSQGDDTTTTENKITADKMTPSVNTNNVDVTRALELTSDDDSIEVPSIKRIREDSGVKMVDGGNKMVEGGNKMAEGGNKMADGGKKMAEGGIKMADGGNKMAASTSRLIDEMKKLDDEQGKPSSKPRTSIIDHGKNILESDSDASMDGEKLQPSPEVKKKMARKITDYFNRKS